MSVVNSSSSPPCQLMEAAPVSLGERPLVLDELTEHLVCTLCAGYFIDATCVVECLHTFCRSCILRHLQVSSLCPAVTCDVMIHRTKAACSLRQDSVLQNLVYKMVPGLHRNEMERRRRFYSSQPPLTDASLPAVCRGEDDPGGIRFFSPDQNIDLRVQYASVCRDQVVLVRYLRCVAAMPISVLKKFLCQKYQLAWDQSIRMDIIHGRKILPDGIRLIDVCYMVNWNKKYLKLIFRLCRVTSLSDIPLVKRRKRSRSVDRNLPKLTPKQLKTDDQPQIQTYVKNSPKQFPLPALPRRKTGRKGRKKRGIGKFCGKKSAEGDSREFSSTGVGVSLVVADSVKTLLAKSQLPGVCSSNGTSQSLEGTCKREDRRKSVEEDSAVEGKQTLAYVCNSKPSSDSRKESGIDSAVKSFNNKNDSFSSTNATVVESGYNPSTKNDFKTLDRSVVKLEEVKKTGSSLRSVRVNSVPQPTDAVVEKKRVSCVTSAVNTMVNSSSPSVSTTNYSANSTLAGKYKPQRDQVGVSIAPIKTLVSGSQYNASNDRLIKSTENGALKRPASVVGLTSLSNKKRFTETSAQTYLALKKDKLSKPSELLAVRALTTDVGGPGNRAPSQCSPHVLHTSTSYMHVSVAVNGGKSPVGSSLSPEASTKTDTRKQNVVKPVTNGRKDITAVLNHLRHNSLSACASMRNATPASQAVSPALSFSRSFGAAIIPIYRTTSTSSDMKQIGSTAKSSESSVGLQYKPSQLVSPQQHSSAPRRSVPPQLMPISVGMTTPSLPTPSVSCFSGPLHVHVDEYAEQRATDGSTNMAMRNSTSSGNRLEPKVDRPVFPVIPQIQRLPRNHSVRHIPNPSLLMQRSSLCSSSTPSGTNSTHSLTGPAGAIKVSPTAGSTASPDLAVTPTLGSATVDETIDSVVSGGRLAPPTIFSLQRQLNEAGTTITLATTTDGKTCSTVS